MEDHKLGDVVEPITHPGYTRATKKRKLAEQIDELDKTLAVRRFAIVDLPNDDPLYLLRFGLVKIVAVSEERVEFNWWTYVGYPLKKNPTYATKWQLQILKGKGQKRDKGWCHPSQVVMTFKSLTKSNTIPNVGRLAPLKMIRRALNNEFGQLPQDVQSDGSEYEPGDMSEDSEEEACVNLGRVTRQTRNKRVK